jgi:hypothetical protein
MLKHTTILFRMGPLLLLFSVYLEKKITEQFTFCSVTNSYRYTELIKQPMDKRYTVKKKIFSQGENFAKSIFNSD